MAAHRRAGAEHIMQMINPAQSMYAGVCPNPGPSSNLCPQGYVWSMQHGKCVPGDPVGTIFQAMNQTQVGGGGISNLSLSDRRPAVGGLSPWLANPMPHGAHYTSGWAPGTTPLLPGTIDTIVTVACQKPGLVCYIDLVDNPFTGGQEWICFCGGGWAPAQRKLTAADIDRAARAAGVSHATVIAAFAEHRRRKPRPQGPGALSSRMCSSSDDCPWPQRCIDNYCHTPAPRQAARNPAVRRRIVGYKVPG